MGQRTVVKRLSDSADVTFDLRNIFHLRGDSDYISVQVADLKIQLFWKFSQNLGITQSQEIGKVRGLKRQEFTT
jgi:hypothetical protein